MELFAIACSTCGARLKVVDAAAIGQILGCPKCGSMVQVTPPKDWRPPTVPTAATVFEGGPPASGAPPAVPAPAAAQQPAAASAAQPTHWMTIAGASAAVVVVGVIAAAVFMSGKSNSSSSVATTAPAPTVAAPSAQAESAPVEPPVAAPARLDLRWIPSDSERVISFRWNDVSAQVGIRSLIKQFAPPHESVEHSLAAAKLDSAQVHRLTWAGGAEDKWLSAGVAVIELESPLEHRGTPLKEKLGEFAAYRFDAAAWPHPWMQVGPRTIVTGPLPALRLLVDAADVSEEHTAVGRLLRAIHADHHVTLASFWGDVPHQDSLMAVLNRWFAAEPDWNVLRDEPAGVALAIDFDRPLQMELALLCASQATADQVHASLDALLIVAGSRLADPPTGSGNLPLSAVRQPLANAIEHRETGIAFPTVWARLSCDADFENLLAAFSHAADHTAPAETVAQTNAGGETVTALKPPVGTPSTTQDAKTAAPDADIAAELPAAPQTSNPNLERIEARLAERLPAIEFSQLPLTDLVDVLKDLTTLSVAIDLQALAEVGVSPDDRVSARLSDKSVAQLLDESLAPLKLGFVIERDQVLITNVRRQQESRTNVEYATADLAADEAALKDLAALVESMVEPASWQKAGGKGTVTTSPQGLLVHQSRPVHRQIQQTLDKLRLARGLASDDNKSGLTLVTRAVQAHERLTRPVTANFSQETPLEKVLGHLQRSTNSTILIDSAALAGEGLSTEVPTTLKVTKKPLLEALTTLLEPLGLAWRAIDERTFQVTTATAAAMPELEFYPAADLLPADKNPQQLVERVQQAFTAGDSSRTPRSVHFDRASGYLLFLASQRDQAMLESLLGSWRAGADKPM